MWLNNDTQNRLISMTYWYPIVAELEYRTRINPPTEMVVGSKSPNKLLETVKISPPEVQIRSPKTLFVSYQHHDIMKILDGEIPEGWDYLIDAINIASEQFGYPVFIRTESSSDKHSWVNSCFLDKKSSIGNNLYGLIEHSAMADLPCSIFAIRELIKTRSIYTAFHGKMPIAKEARVFAKNGEVLCFHPYWPREAFLNFDKKLEDNVTEEKIALLQLFTTDEEVKIKKMAKLVSKYIDGEWSIDFLQDKKGDWWLIDMALAQRSYHWPDCTRKAQESI